MTGGLYFGEPKHWDESAAVDSLTYTRAEIERIIEKAFEIAATRNKKVTSVDKANVLASSKLWRKIAEEVASRHPDITLEHLYIDAAAMLMIQRPTTFDVIVTENLFGDILSDEASVITGSLGMLLLLAMRKTDRLYTNQFMDLHQISLIKILPIQCR